MPPREELNGACTAESATGGKYCRKRPKACKKKIARRGDGCAKKGGALGRRANSAEKDRYTTTAASAIQQKISSSPEKTSGPAGERRPSQSEERKSRSLMSVYQKKRNLAGEGKGHPSLKKFLTFSKKGSMEPKKKHGKRMQRVSSKGKLRTRRDTPFSHEEKPLDGCTGKAASGRTGEKKKGHKKKGGKSKTSAGRGDRQRKAGVQSSNAVP